MSTEQGDSGRDRPMLTDRNLTQHLRRMRDAGLAIGIDVRADWEREEHFGHVSFRIGWRRGKRIEYQRTLVTDETLDNHADMLAAIIARTAEAVLGREILERIGKAVEVLERSADSRQASVEMVGAHADGTTYIVPADTDGWPSPIIQTVVHESLAAFRGYEPGDEAELAPIQSVAYYRGLLDPDRGVWRYDASSGQPRPT